MSRRIRIQIPGIVQGIGFRPWVAKVADRFGLTGFVLNNGCGVVLEAQATGEENLAFFLSELATRSDQGLWIKTVIPVLETEATFEIKESETAKRVHPVLSPDRAICDECRRELFEPFSRRVRYPFISCADCGPRQSVTFALPFDRSRTSWGDWPMCHSCLREYTNRDDRRYHAQTTSCPTCGPTLQMRGVTGLLEAQGDPALFLAAEKILRGEVIAVKGTSGFHLFADATCEDAAKKVRELKRRPTKPLALMVESVEQALNLCNLSEQECKTLRSPEAPIVLARVREGELELRSWIAPGLNRIGLFLAPTGLHALLLQAVGRPLIATSGNRESNPICIDFEEARKALGQGVSGFLVHELKIQNRQEDSIVQFVDQKAVCLRRSRGYPLRLGWKVPRPQGHPRTLLAAGADLKSAIAFLQEDDWILSSYLGSLDSIETIELYEETLEKLPKFYGASPQQVIVDAHPDYRSASRARGESKWAVGHHLAHFASVIAEHSLWNERVLGVSWDGTGYGADGRSWGGEFFLAEGARVRRMASLHPFALMGADFATKEPRRVALALAWEAGVSLSEEWMRRTFSQEEARIFRKVWEQGPPQSSSVGRLFDGVAAILGLRTRIDYEGQAAMELQAFAELATKDRIDLVAEVLKRPSWSTSKANGIDLWDWRPLIQKLIAATVDGDLSVDEQQVLALEFHLDLVRLILDQAVLARGFVSGPGDLKKIALSGGVFQNALLLELTLESLRRFGFEPYWNQIVPPNDGGIAIGQLACALAYPEELQSC